MATVYVTTGGNDSTGDGSSGNPYATPGKAAGVATTSGDLIWVKSGTYTLTTSSSNVAGGIVSLADGVKMEGYNSTTGDMGTAPVINAGSVIGVTLVTLAGNYDGRRAACVNIEANGNNGSGNNGFDVSSPYTRYLAYCTARNCPGSGFIGSGNGFSSGAYLLAVACGEGFLDGTWVGCTARDCASNGFHFDAVNGSCAVRCLSVFNGGEGFAHANYQSRFIECVAHGNTLNGFKLITYDIAVLVNCVSTNNGSYGYYFPASGSTPLIVSCAVGGGASANSSGAFTTGSPSYHVGAVVLSADPWTNAAGYDFTPNTTSGGGALLRALGLGVRGQSSYPDLGAVQHQDSGGGGGGGIIYPAVLTGNYHRSN